jgi:hypothetical protein
MNVMDSSDNSPSDSNTVGSVPIDGRMSGEIAGRLAMALLTMTKSSKDALPSYSTEL